MDPITLAAISAGVGLVSNIWGSETNNANSKANVEAQKWENHQNRLFAMDMWNRTNDYNTPLMQMQRFRQAGLNPHLIYGQGNAGNAQMASTPMGKAPVHSRTSPNLGDPAMSYVAMRRQQTEIDNLEKAKEVMEADRVNKNAQTVGTLATAAKTDQEREHAAQLFNTTMAQAQANLQQTGVQTQKAIQETENLVDQLKTSQAQREAIKQTISESAARIKNLQLDNDVKGIQKEIDGFKRDLWRQGINPESSAYERILKGMLDATGFPQFLDQVRKNGLFRPLNP